MYQHINFDSFKDLPRRVQRYGLDELDMLIRNGGLHQLFRRFANDYSRHWSLIDRKAFEQLSEGAPVNSGLKNRREPKKIISTLNSENDVGKSNYAHKSTTGKDHFPIHSCNSLNK